VLLGPAGDHVREGAGRVHGQRHRPGEAVLALVLLWLHLLQGGKHTQLSGSV
jgi:hypothetical protein